MYRHVIATSLVVLSIYTVTTALEDTAYWRRVAQDNVLRYLDYKPNTNVAKNVILFVGDGLGLSTVMAARTLRGQMDGKQGEETVLAMETLPNVGLAKVYSVNKQVPDSAATATAIMTGVKTHSRVVGLGPSAKYDECVNITENRLTTMLHWSQKAGKSTGIVTTTRVTHATPASAYAAVPNRKWENSYKVPKGCTDIAHQLIHDNSDIQVILGGGSRNFVPSDIPDPVTGTTDYRKQRFDGQDLLQKWKNDKITRNLTSKFVVNKGELENVDAKTTDFLFGLFAPSHLDYEMERLQGDQGPTGQPSIADMTRKALEILQKNKKGYFLMVEGGRIDHAHHATSAKKALIDTLAFDDAVNMALNMTDEEDTLVIVTADHSHVMTVAGYSSRGHDILGKVDTDTASDHIPYTTLGYTNGPSYRSPRQDIHFMDTTHDDYKQAAGVPMGSETHSGEDVPIYSRGPMSHLLTGVKEQNVIAYVMAHAACVGDTGIACNVGRVQRRVDQTTKSSIQCQQQLTHTGGNDGRSVVQSVLFVAIFSVLNLFCF